MSSKICFIRSFTLHWKSFAKNHRLSGLMLLATQSSVPESSVKAWNFEPTIWPSNFIWGYDLMQARTALARGFWWKLNHLILWAIFNRNTWSFWGLYVIHFVFWSVYCQFCQCWCMAGHSLAGRCNRFFHPNWSVALHHNSWGTESQWEF